ncbi:hypothetical protein L6259_02440 [Candidatus Parcubacteria bacterium]|nr:hypothetical protein [Patescibacteria group bacterium]MCG2694106.1 hypothetical protein [Candidatus Parcubacteria bacterium]
MEEKELKWKVPEYPQYARGRNWYIIAAILGILLLAYSVITGNFLFAVIVILAVLISVLSSHNKVEDVEFKLFQDGVKMDNILYPWDKFQAYWIVKEEDKENHYNLGLDLKNVLKTDLYVPIKNYDVKEVEEFVARHLKNNPDRKEEPLSYLIGRKLKI